MFKISSILVNYLENPPYVSQMPNLGWKLVSDNNNVNQKSYCIGVFKDSSFSIPVYDSGTVMSDESAHIKPEFTIEDLTRYYIKVKVTSTLDEEAVASASFISGISGNSSWGGLFISPETEDEKDISDTSLIRRDISITKEISSAYIACTAGGLYELSINGEKVSDDYFTPGWTSYNKRLQYQVYDVSSLLKNGSNTLGVLLGAGWYKGKMSYNLNRNHYGTRTCYAARAVINYCDGTSEIITTDKSWKHSKGPVLFSEIYDGETCDFRKEQKGWDCPGFDDICWEDCSQIDFDVSVITNQDAPGVKVINELPAIDIITTPKGDTVVDFGQNTTGWCKLHISDSNPDDEIVVKYFETLDDDGNVYLDNLRTAKQTITIISNGGEIDYRPHFTFQGFRYAWIVKWSGELSVENFTACALHTAMPETGSFTCSSDLVNGLQHNILWSMKGNSLDVPTDCPQRDERLGWTGDVQIFNSTAMFLMNAYGFYSKWLKDVEADQYEDGSIPHIVPDIVSGKSAEDWLTSQGCSGASAWADVAIILPWNLYLTYGDKDVILRQYNSMKRWISFMKNHSERGCLFAYKLQFGDWVALDAEEGSYFGATPTLFTSAAYYCYVVRLFARMAHAIGNIKDAEEYGAFADELKLSFINEFVDGDQLRVNTQTAQIVALYFDLLPDDCKTSVANNLKKLLDANNGHLLTGFIGTPYFCHALADNGYVEDAYDLLLKEDFPSWLYQVKRGATTVWEHWDGLKPDGTMWSPDMNSFNHYAYGAVGDWLYKGVCGLRQDIEKPGYKHFYVCPHPSSKLGKASLKYESIYGLISISWETDGKEAELTVNIPVNTSATLIPEGYTTDLSSNELTSGTHTIHCILK